MRTVPGQLQNHVDQVSTTTCWLLRIQLRSGLVYGLTNLDQNLTYDDGDGEVEYIAVDGFDPSAISADIGFSVDNAEGYALISADVPQVTVEMVEAGELDDAQWSAYLVNYEDLSDGHLVLDAGDLGQVRTRQGIIWIPELLSYAMRLRQPVGHVWQRTCRATFGTDPESQTGCGFDADSLWSSGTVLTVGAETDREFDGDLVTASQWPTTPYPGRLEWLTGDNVGRQYSLESFDADSDSGTVVLAEPMPYPIQVGDTYRLRPDCGKRYAEDCVSIWDNGPNFKGEPLIPVGDAVALQIAGAQISKGGGFVGATIDLVEQINGSDFIEE